MGRPTKCTKKVEAEVCRRIREGCSQATAARLAGIDPSSHWLWIRKGEEGGRRYARYSAYSHAVKEALADWEADLIRRITEATEPYGKDRGSWQAAAWLLERRKPDDYGRKTRIEQTGAGGGPIQVEQKGGVAVKLVGKSTAALESLLDELEDEAEG